MKYFIVRNSAPATLADARECVEYLKWYNVPTSEASVCHVGGRYGIETTLRDISGYIPRDIHLIPLKYEHVEGFIPREYSNNIADLIYVWGGKVNALSEAFEDTYIDADVLDDGLVNKLIKTQLL